MSWFVQGAYRLAWWICGSNQELYDIEELIMDGEFATIRKCRAVRTKKEFAVKIYRVRDCGREQKRRFGEEVKVCSELVYHRHIIQFHASTRKNGLLYLVFSLLRGSQLFDGLIHRGTCSERDAANYTAQIMSGIAFLHSSNVIHADIRPENVMFKSQWYYSSVKIIDLHSVISIKSKKIKTRIGKFGMRGRREYRAPEMVKGEKYGRGVDVWSAGVLLCNLLTGNPPFEGASDEELYHKIKSGSGNIDFHAPEWQSVARQGRRLVRQLLLQTPVDRISAIGALRHPFLRNHGLSSFLSKVTKKSVMLNLVRLNHCQQFGKKSVPLRTKCRTVSDPVWDRLEYANASLRHLHLIDSEEPYLNDVETTSRPSLWPKATVLSRAGSRQSPGLSSSQDQNESQYYSSSDDDYAKVAAELRPGRLPRKRANTALFWSISEEFENSAFGKKSRRKRSRRRDTVSRHASVASTSTSSRPTSQGASCSKSTPKASESKKKKFPAREDKSLEASNSRDKVVGYRKREAPDPVGTGKLRPVSLWQCSLAMKTEDEDSDWSVTG